jgi:eukaryotic-like serine/threonine-protein kinase
MPAQAFDEEALFHAARRIEETAARQLFIAQAAGDDAALAARVRALLEMHEQEPASAQEPMHTAEHTPSGPPTVSMRFTFETEGTIIAGRYKLLQQIGEGGMGTVWMADQTEPVKRRVAVKLIRTERGTSRSILSRFEAERQAIALMDHPNIAKLLDAGTTDAGSPYFVMELVKGVPLTEFCDEHKLSIQDRLKLFMQICGAVQHAHQKGIIHRDLKPSNILVAPYDDKPVPKVIDFGLAKAMHQTLTERTLHTAH